MKRRQKLKAIQVRLPVHADQARTPELDSLALEAANRLSATLVKGFKFEGKTISQLATGIEYLVYSAKGTPKDG